MNTSSNVYNNVDDYIASFEPPTQEILNDIRTVVRNAAPEAIESIAYGMPAYKHNKKPIAYFAAFRHHIGFYATPHAHEEFGKRLSVYKQGKGSVQFPIDQPMPLDLIADMVTYNVAQK